MASRAPSKLRDPLSKFQQGGWEPRIIRGGLKLLIALEILEPKWQEYKRSINPPHLERRTQINFVM